MAQARRDCYCVAGWTGSNCEFSKCGNSLPWLSLGSLFVQSDTQLRLYSANYLKNDYRSVSQYVRSLLSIQVDLNGDGVVTYAELLSALTYRSIKNIPLGLPVWRTSAQPGSQPYADAITLDDLFGQMMDNYNSGFHSFDGSGNSLVDKMISTYPDPSWPVSQCKRSDMTYNKKPSVHTVWKISSVSSITRVCGYINGNLSTSFGGTVALSGSQPFFNDNNTALAASQNFKRIYCLSVEYCNSGAANINHSCPLGDSDKRTSFECSVGLFYVSKVTNG